MSANKKHTGIQLKPKVIVFDTFWTALRKLFGYSCQINNFPSHICDLYWLRNGTKPKFLNVQIIIVIFGVNLPPAEVTSTEFEFALGICAVALHCGGSLCPLSSDRRFTETAWQARRGEALWWLFPVRYLTWAARDQGEALLLCALLSHQQLQRSTVLATVPNDLEEQWFDDSHLPKVL